MPGAKGFPVFSITSGSNIFQLLKDAKVSFADVFFIKVGDKVVKEDYLLTESVEVKLFPIIGGR